MTLKTRLERIEAARGTPEADSEARHAEALAKLNAYLDAIRARTGDRPPPTPEETAEIMAEFQALRAKHAATDKG